MCGEALERERGREPRVPKIDGPNHGLDIGVLSPKGRREISVRMHLANTHNA